MKKTFKNYEGDMIIMNEYLIIGLKTILFLAIILIIIRIMGKRELGQLNVFDIIISFMISEIFSNAIADPNTNIFLALLPIFIIFIVQISMSYIVLHNKKIRDFIESKPTLIIENGIINYSEMKKQRYNISDLLQQVHQQGIDNLNCINFAILENNGNLSIIKKKDSKLGFPFPVITDGKIDFNELKQTNLSSDELFYKIEKANYVIEDIFMAFIDENLDLIIFSKKSNNVK